MVLLSYAPGCRVGSKMCGSTHGVFSAVIRFQKYFIIISVHNNITTPAQLQYLYSLIIKVLKKLDYCKKIQVRSFLRSCKYLYDVTNYVEKK